MKDKIYCVSLNEFIRVTTGWLYSLAPGHKPRFINEIVDEMIVRFKRDAKHIGNDFFYYEVDWFQLRVLVEYILMPIKQFRDLNLSKREYGFGIAVDDPNRKEFAFISRGSSIPEEHDFIDLDACIQNIVFSLKQICGMETSDEKELLSALNYDRNQYEQGYTDGYSEAIKNISEKLKEIGIEFNYLDDLIRDKNICFNG